MHTPLTRMPAQGWVPPVVVVVAVVVVVLDVVVELVVVDARVVVVAGRVVVVVADVVVVVGFAVVVVTFVDDVVVEFGGAVATPPTLDGTHSVRSGVNRRERFARLTSKHTNTGPEVTAAGATIGGAVGAGTHSPLGSRTRSCSCSRSPTFTGNGGVKRVVTLGG